MDIEITALTKTYRGGVHALSGIDLQIPTGMFGLLGTNGAGKTTLMRILAGVLPAFLVDPTPAGEAQAVRVADLAAWKDSAALVVATRARLPITASEDPTVAARSNGVELCGATTSSQRQVSSAGTLPYIPVATTSGSPSSAGQRVVSAWEICVAPTARTTPVPSDQAARDRERRSARPSAIPTSR